MRQARAQALHVGLLAGPAAVEGGRAGRRRQRLERGGLVGREHAPRDALHGAARLAPARRPRPTGRSGDDGDQRHGRPDREKLNSSVVPAHARLAVRPALEDGAPGSLPRRSDSTARSGACRPRSRGRSPARRRSRRAQAWLEGNSRGTREPPQRAGRRLEHGRAACAAAGRSAPPGAAARPLRAGSEHAPPAPGATPGRRCRCAKRIPQVWTAAQSRDQQARQAGIAGEPGQSQQPLGGRTRPPRRGSSPPPTSAASVCANRKRRISR